MPRVDLIGMVVSDLKRSVAFYQRLGVEFGNLKEGLESGHIEAILPGGIRLALDTIQNVREFDPGWNPPIGASSMGLAFLCESPAQVDQLFKEMVADGAEAYKAPWDAFWGQRYAQLKDPDNHHIDLFAPLET